MLLPPNFQIPIQSYTLYVCPQQTVFPPAPLIQQEQPPGSIPEPAIANPGLVDRLNQGDRYDPAANRLYAEYVRNLAQSGPYNASNTMQIEPDGAVKLPPEIEEEPVFDPIKTEEEQKEPPPINLDQPMTVWDKLVEMAKLMMQAPGQFAKSAASGALCGAVTAILCSIFSSYYFSGKDFVKTISIVAGVLTGAAAIVGGCFSTSAELRRQGDRFRQLLQVKTERN